MCISRERVRETGRIRANNQVIVFIWERGRAGSLGEEFAEPDRLARSLALSRLLDHCYPIELLLSLRFQLAGVCY